MIFYELKDEFFDYIQNKVRVELDDYEYNTIRQMLTNIFVQGMIFEENGRRDKLKEKTYVDKLMEKYEKGENYVDK